MPRKRKSSGASTSTSESVGSPKIPVKLTATEPVYEVSDEDDDMRAVRRRITQLESDEALARQLASEVGVQGREDTVDEDAALARKLAAEDGLLEDEDDYDDGDFDADSYGFGGMSDGEDEPLYDFDDGDHTDEPMDTQTLSPADEAAMKRITDFFTRYSQPLKCAHCQRQLVGTPLLLVTFSDRLDTFRSKIAHSMVASCTCKHKTCRGCLTVFDHAQCDKDSISHCAESRAIVVYQVLRALDALWYPESTDDNSIGTKAKPVHEPLYIKAERAAKAPSGIGYGGQYTQSPRKGAAGSSSSTTVAKAQAKAQTLDRKCTTLLSMLEEFLPNGNPDEGVYQVMPHPALVAMLRHSSLLRGPSPLLISLVRNDSLMDVVQRSGLFLKVLGILKAFARNECLVPFLAESLDDYGAKRVLQTLYTGSKVDVQKESTPRPPLMDLLQDIVTQSQTFVRTVESAKVNEQLMATDDMNVDETIGVAMEIASVHEHIQTAVQQWRAHSNTAGRRPTNDSNNDQKQSQPPRLSYVDAMKPLAFEYADFTIRALNDNIAGYRHAHSKEIMSSSTTVTSQNNMLHAAKEQATLRTNVPQADSTSCWVRVDETRFDVLKVMISGPEDTPYENGLFLFDIFLPSSYPEKPPLVQLQTTGNGSVRFNPNLYNNGKVCLSLLGTWSGQNASENWVPRKSTLLQVLISIQTMILVSLPYFNEPGYGVPNAASPQSIAYNDDIRRQTVNWAMVDMLRKPPLGFEDVVKAHFWMKRRQILDGQRARWVDLDRQRPNQTERLFRELKVELTKLGNEIKNSPTLSHLYEQE